VWNGKTAAAFAGVSLRGQAQGKLILPTWFDHLEDSFSYKEGQLKKFCLPVKTSCPPSENVNETSAYVFF